MNWVDVFLVIILGINILNGIKSGFALSLIEFIRFVASVIVALLTFGWAAYLFQVFGIADDVSMFLGFSLVMVIVQIFLVLTLKPVTDRIKEALKDSPVSPFDKAFGPLPQITMFLISMSFLLALIVTFPIYAPLKEAVLASRFGKPLAAPAIRIIDKDNTVEEVKYAPPSDSV